MKIGLVIYPAIEPVITALKHVPQIGHNVYYRAKLYDVTGVFHNVDECVIKVLLIPHK